MSAIVNDFVADSATKRCEAEGLKFFSAPKIVAGQKKIGYFMPRAGEFDYRL